MLKSNFNMFEGYTNLGVGPSLSCYQGGAIKLYKCADMADPAHR